MGRWANENTWDAAINDAASRYDVPVALIKAIIAQESAFKPSASRAEPAVNDASIGLMQILYGTAKGEGYTGPVGTASTLTGLYDPATNIRFGTSYLASSLQDTRGNILAGISAYNGGFRPDIGFGAKATRQMTICLARDNTGKCISSRVVQPGEFSNQSYVNAVLNNMAYFEQQLAVKPTVIPVTSVPLTDARHDNLESEIGGRDRRADNRTLETHEALTPNTFIRIVQWFIRLLNLKRP